MSRLRNRPIFRGAALLAGLALTALVVYFALGSDWHRALAPLGHANPWLIVALAAAVVVQLLLTSLLFWVVTLTFDLEAPVGPVRMLQVIAASSLLNYLPFEAGLLSRAAYLKLRHGLPVRQSVFIQLAVITLSILVPGTAVAIALAPSFITPEVKLMAAAVVVAALSAATGPLAARLLKRRVVKGWLWVPIRTAELLTGAGRLWLAFQIIGHPAGFAEVLVAAAAGFFVSLLSPTPNGLGVREITISTLTGLMSPTMGAAGALASLVDRAVEAVIFGMAGWWSIERLRRAVQVDTQIESSKRAK